ncbi:MULTISPECIES: cellulose biosynthesis protein BcsC [Rheinheimera]|uniref:Cellulose synthase subunit BcsC-related outer membrane protein n=1 Tax=Rheinheimera marina TaxID=1774958 RepID=A0ABV9JIY2_9GAMM
MNKSLWAALALSVCGQLAAADNQTTFNGLFEQADFWQERNRSDLARDALQKILAADPNNLEAIYRMGVLAARDNNEPELKKWSGMLASLSPLDPRLKELNAVQVARQIDPATLSEARRLAASGQYDLAISRYRDVFGGNSPTQDLAAEYYLTLAGTPDGLAVAKKELKQLHELRPASGSIRLAYAQVLSYDESSRRDGIRRLADLAPNSETARSNWRQALLWLDVKPSDKALYEQYNQQNPDDIEVMDYFKNKAKTGSTAAILNSRTLGYRALDNNRISQAENYFRQALTENQNDAEALAGIGLIRLKQQQFSQAKDTLGRAMAMAPAKSANWRQAYLSADFYSRMARVQQLIEQQSYDQAQTEVTALAKFPAPFDLEAQVVAGQLQHKQGQLEQAKSTFQAILQKKPNHSAAKLGLVGVLQSMGRWEDAERLSAQLSESERGQIAGLSQPEVQRLRADAANSNELLAEISLRRALKLAPDDPWVRLDLARLLQKQDEPARARAVLEPLLSKPDADSRFAAAMFASEQQRWRDVEQILGTVPLAQQTAAMRELNAQAAARAKLSRVLQRTAAGDQQHAQQIITEMMQQGSMGASAAGDLASELLKNGQSGLAYQVVETDLMRGMNDAPAQYLNHITVLNETGHARQAKLLLSELMLRSDLSLSDKELFDQLQRGLAVREADTLRNEGQLALAYDLLAAHLRDFPEDESLLLAMARLYQDGKKTTEAEQIYDYVLRLKPQSKEALSGAVELALQKNDPERARLLLNKLNWNNNQQPDWLILAARVAQAEGDHDKATELLVKARKLAYQNTAVWGQTAASTSANPFRDNAQTENNPFRDRKQSRSFTRNSRPDWLPGQPGNADVQSAQVSNPTATVFEQIDSMLGAIEQDTQTRIDTDVVLRVREGSDGSSGLAAVETPVTLSTGLLGGRIEASVTPVSLNSGTVESENDINLFGRGAVVNASSGLSARMEVLGDVLDDIDDLGVAYENAKKESDAAAISPNESPANIARLEAVTAAAKTVFDRAAAIDLFQTFDLTGRNLSASQLQLIDEFLNENYGASTIALDSTSVEAFRESRARLESLIAAAQDQLDTLAISTGNPQTQRNSGVALAFGYKNDFLSADVGTTPLGFEKTNVVGGVKVQPEIAKNTRIVVQGERRAVKDSLLSYAGTTDHVSGERWGAVTKTGGSVGLNFDNGAAGAYGAVSKHKYDGDNVASNRSEAAEVGAYYRPVHEVDEQLQLGIHVSYNSFDKNLSKFTFGHGGYFSPQDYVSVAFPLSYGASASDWSYNLLFAPGFQSYSEDGNSLFPTDAAAQAALDLFYALGAFDQAGYAPSSKSGFGMSFGLNGEYRPSPDLKFGGQVAYDSFGEYNESVIRLYMKYLVGGTND